MAGGLKSTEPEEVHKWAIVCVCVFVGWGACLRCFFFFSFVCAPVRSHQLIECGGPCIHKRGQDFIALLDL